MLRRDQTEPTAAKGARVASSGAPMGVAVLVGSALLFLIAVRKGFRGSVVKL